MSQLSLTPFGVPTNKGANSLTKKSLTPTHGLHTLLSELSIILVPFSGLMPPHQWLVREPRPSHCTMFQPSDHLTSSQGLLLQPPCCFLPGHLLTIACQQASPPSFFLGSRLFRAWTHRALPWNPPTKLQTKIPTSALFRLDLSFLSAALFSLL